MSLCLRVFVWLLIIAALFGVSSGIADKVYLKDGTVEVSERVWQSEKYVHFVLRGTSDVTIRYAKTIVDRVLIDGVEERVSPSAPLTKPKTPAQIPPRALTPAKDIPPPKAVTEAKTPIQANKKPITIKVPVTQPKMIDQKMVMQHKGINFYDPRRDLRYWASNKSKHSTLGAALAALAKMYGVSVRWVETYMGNENDLGAIHHNLMMNQGQRSEVNTEEATDQTPSQGLFYNQGQASPYRIGPNKVFTSQAEAVKALARQYGRTTLWVQENFGQSNELKTINENLNNAMQKPDATGQQETIALERAGETPAKGNEFYNPRREKKYWIGETEQYNSLDDALGALAKQYGVTVELIEQYMGNTNDLAQIHQNLRAHLK